MYTDLACQLTQLAPTVLAAHATCWHAMQASQLVHRCVPQGALTQTGLVVLSSLVLWAFRTEASDGYGYIG